MKTQIVGLALLALGCNDGRMSLGEAARELADCHAAKLAIEQLAQADESASNDIDARIAKLYREPRQIATSKLSLRINELTILIGSEKLPK